MIRPHARPDLLILGAFALATLWAIARPAQAEPRVQESTGTTQDPAQTDQESPPVAANPGVVEFSNDNIRLLLSGRVHRMLQTADDGASTQVFYTDSLQGPTMIRFDVETKESGSVKFGAVLEVGLQANSPLLVSQNTPEAGITVSGRLSEFYVEPGFGRISVGRGFMASWVSAEIDLSGTQFASLLPVGNLFPGLLFVDDPTGALSNVRIDTYFADLQRLLIKDRIRYDSPGYKGLQLSGDIAADSRWDTAIRLSQSAGDFTIRGAATYQRRPFADLRWRWDFGGSVRHERTGLNGTFGYSRQQTQSGRNSNSFIIKGGWLARLVSIGTTAFSADFTRNADTVVGGDIARSIGAFAVQSWTKYGVSFYAGVRRFDVDRPVMPLRPITIFPIGGVFSF